MGKSESQQSLCTPPYGNLAILAKYQIYRVNNEWLNVYVTE